MRVVIRDKKTIRELKKAITITHVEKLGIDFAVVSCSQRPNRKTYHPIDEGFLISNKSIKISIHISADALQIWKELDFKPSLFDVQNAVNMLKAMRDDVTIKNVEHIFTIHHLKY